MESSIAHLMRFVESDVAQKHYSRLLNAVDLQDLDEKRDPKSRKGQAHRSPEIVKELCIEAKKLVDKGMPISRAIKKVGVGNKSFYLYFPPKKKK